MIILGILYLKVEQISLPPLSHEFSMQIFSITDGMVPSPILQRMLSGELTDTSEHLNLVGELEECCMHNQGLSVVRKVVLGGICSPDLCSTCEDASHALHSCMHAHI